MQEAAVRVRGRGTTFTASPDPDLNPVPSAQPTTAERAGAAATASGLIETDPNGPSVVDP